MSRTDGSKRPRLGLLIVALLVVVSLVVQSCTGADTFDDPEVFDGPSAEQVAASIRETGIGVVESVSEYTGDPWLTVTEAQLVSMASEVASQAGLTGHQLDAVMPPMPNGTPHFAYWIAAWLHDTPTERARVAANWYPEDTDWSQAPNLRFPRAVLMLFVADVAEDINANQPPLDPEHRLVPVSTDETDTRGGPLLVSASPVAQSGVTGDLCVVVTTFFEKQISALFNMLRLPNNWLGGGVFGFVGGLLADLWNTVVALAGKTVQALVRNLTAPVLEWVGKAVAIAGVISHISSHLNGWSVELVKEPASIHWGPPPRTGLFRVQPAKDHHPWDEDLKACAQAFGITLPDLLRPGATVDWTVETSERWVEGPELIVETHRDDIVPQGRRLPELRYTTPQETLDPPHEGEYQEGTVTVHVRAPRADLHNVLILAREQIARLIAGLVPDIPAVDLRQRVREGLNDLLNPVLNDLERALTGEFDSVLVVGASQILKVGYHTPTTTTTVPQPSPTPPRRPPEEAGEEGRPSSPPCEAGCGTSHGDPHMETVDGHQYEFQAAGEFVLLRSTNGTVEIQARYAPVLPADDLPVDVSYATAVAARLGAHRVAWYEGRGAFIDGEPVLSGNVVEFEGGRVEVFPGGMVVEFAEGTVLYAIAGGYLAIVIDPSDDLRATGMGLLGPVTGGGLGVPPLPDGTVLPEPTDRDSHFNLLYRQLGPAWRVSATTSSLFDYLDGESPDTFFLDDFPRIDRVALSLGELLEELLRGRFPGLFADQAEQACVSVDDPNLNQKCVFDVAVTGDDLWVGQYETTELLLTEGPQALEPVLPRPVAGRAGEPTLQLQGSIGGPGRSALAGSIDAAEGTVLLARVSTCPPDVEISLDVQVRDRSGEPFSRVPATLCTPERPLGSDDDDEYVPTEAYVWLSSAGVHDVSLSTNAPTLVTVEVDVFVDPNPTVVRATGDDLTRFSDTYLLEGIADTVVYELTHSDGSVSFSQPSGFGPDGACGNLSFGAPTPGETMVWHLGFCGHSDTVYVGYVSGLVVPMIAFNRTGLPIEVTLGPPD